MHVQGFRSLVERIKREKEESRRGFGEFLAAMGVSSLREYVSQVAGALA